MDFPTILQSTNMPSIRIESFGAEDLAVARRLKVFCELPVFFIQVECLDRKTSGTRTRENENRCRLRMSITVILRALRPEDKQAGRKGIRAGSTRIQHGCREDFGFRRLPCPRIQNMAVATALEMKRLGLGS